MGTKLQAGYPRKRRSSFRRWTQDTDIYTMNIGISVSALISNLK